MKKGFTLIELLIVMAIIGILAAIAIPAFVGQRIRIKTIDVADTILQGKRLTKEQEEFLSNHPFSETESTFKTVMESTSSKGYTQTDIDKVIYRIKYGSNMPDKDTSKVQVKSEAPQVSKTSESSTPQIKELAIKIARGRMLDDSDYKLLATNEAEVKQEVNNIRRLMNDVEKMAIK